MEDVNDFNPQIFPQSAELTLVENSVDLVLTTFVAIDLDSSPEFSTITRYDVLSQEGGVTTPFSISNEGVLRADRSLDAESDPPVFKLFVYAVDKAGARSLPSNVTVYVENINDHQPVFEQAEHYIPVHVNTPKGSKILQVTAIDDDIGQYGEVTYVILDDMPFFIDAMNGTVFTTANFDSESERRMFVFTIVATDGGLFMSTTMVTVELTVDKVFVPEIQQLNYTTCIDENTDLETPILNVMVTDSRNHTIGFRIITEESLPFDINSQGIIYTSNFIVDFESDHSLYTFAVVATNGDVLSEPVMVTVCINNVNDNPPYFQNSEISFLLEEGYTGFVSDIKALDLDGSINTVTYGLVGETHNFVIFLNGSLYLESPLDYEEIDEITLAVVANDTVFQSAPVLVIVNVENINDNAPEFSETEYTVELLENEPASTIIEFLRATDQDAPSGINRQQPAFGQIVSYEILEKDIPFEVRLHPGSRNGLLVNTRAIDFESDPCSYNFRVSAVDGGGLYSIVNASITVLIQNQNDNELKFANETFYFRLFENTIGILGNVVVTDDDQLAVERCPSSQSNAISDIVYTAFGLEGIVTIDSEGQLLVNQPLDYETSNRQLEVVVSAIDGFYSAIATVFINLFDENEFCPEAQETSAVVRIPESVSAESEIYRIVSMDADGDDDVSNILFEILSNDTSLPFAVSADGGIIVTDKIDFDRNQSSYTLLVRIYDNSGDCEGVFVTLRVEVTNLNDERPYFVENSFSFIASESLRPSSLVGYVSARDLDMLGTELFFTIQRSDVPFSVNSSGALILEGALDYEVINRYSFSVDVSDGVNMALQPATVTVIVGNENDHPPSFIGPYTFNLPENELTLFPVNVVDRDDGDMGEISHFSINSSRNDIFVINNDGYIANTIALDYEATSDLLPQMFTLTVCAFDSGNKTACDQFTVILQDVNDNAPQFSQSTYSVEFPEGERLDNIIRVQATDLDKSEVFSFMQYSFSSSSRSIADQFSFTISENGILSSSYVFDYELDPTQIVLTVVAMDIGGLEATATVILNIEDRNEFSPEFNQLQYNLSVSEDFSTGNVFYTFLTTDADGGSIFGAVQRFIINSDNPIPISINSNGSMYLTRKIDYESGDVMFQFSLTAVDNGGLRSNSVSVTVHVIDEEDSPPVFESLLFNTSVRENSLPSQPLTMLTVISESGNVNFEITSLEYVEMFEVSEDGSVYVREQLDFESVRQIILTISAFDGRLYSDKSASVVVNVLPGNDNAPVFAETLLQSTLIENQLQNTLQLLLSATDSDQDSQNPQTRHGIVSEYRLLNKSVPFTLTYNSNSASAFLTNSRPLDAETDLPEYVLIIQAYDALGQSAETPATVIVSLVDVDDNQPAFDQAFYSVNIEENFAGTLLTVHATDLDRDSSSKNIRYLLSGEGSSNFTVGSDGIIRNMRAFDYEVDLIEYTFTVSIEGCTGSTTCSSSIQVSIEDENDNYPMFALKDYSITLPVDSFPIQGGVIGRISASDKDRGVVYGTISEYIVRGDAGPFTVHSTSGDLVVENPVALRQRSQRVQFEIVATDGGGLSNSTQVEINIPIFNLHPPVFEQRFYHVTWEENSFNFQLPGLPINSLLQVRSQDLDRPFTTVTYYLTTLSDDFQMMEDGFLVLKRPLDWEEQGEHQLQVRAYDGLYNSTFNADIRVSVVNQNDNPPMFLQTQYQVNVSEHYRTFNIPIMKIIATDLDSSQIQLSYRILDPTAPFRIDFQGNVYVLAQLDYEITKKYRFGVSVSDGSHQANSPAEVVIHLIDENDHYPFFNQPIHQVSLPENSSPGVFSVSISASDLDSSPRFGEIASYSILESHVPFEIRYNSAGEAFITNTKILDYENDNHIYVFHVHAYDRGGFRSFFPAQVIVTLSDTDDCPPSFSQDIYNAALAENSPAPSFVIKVAASDCDADPRFNRVEFSLENPQGLFSIHPVSGIIMSLRSFDLERGQSHYELQILAKSASDVSLTDRATVNVTIQDANEFHPQFIGAPYSINIPENITVGSPVLTVLATDRDAGPIYGAIENYIIIGNSESLPFNLHPKTGQLSLNSPVDYESGLTRYNVRIAAVDGGMLLSQTIVVVSITNVNDVLPRFIESEYSVNIAENEIDFFLSNFPLNALTQLKVIDPDTSASELSFDIGNATLDAIFSLDFAGYLYLSEPLDYEVQSTYRLEISVSDGVFTSQDFAVVIIDVLNGNDQAPVFYNCLDGCCGNQTVNNLGIIEVNENTKPDLYTLPVVACDIDGDDLSYTLQGGGETFDIVNEILILKKAFDYEVRINWPLTITVSDGIHEATLLVTFIVINANDNLLKFTQEVYSVEVSENIIVTIEVRATDRDLPDSSVEYSIDQPDGEQLPFEVLPRQNGAVISSTKPFDYESSKELYHFNVTAFSRQNDNIETATAQISVFIKDVNEYRPKFTSKHYNVTLYENTQDSVIAKVTATDGDLGQVYGEVEYRLVDSPGDLPCVINENGEIFHTEAVDAERGPDTLEMRVEAVDGGGLKDVALVYVSILDVNDNKPFFSPLNYYALLPEDTPVREVVMTLSAEDNDRSEAYHTISSYEIESSQDIPFEIDSSGSIRLSRTLDYEEGPKTYSFAVAAFDNGNLRSEMPAIVTIDIANVPDQPPVFSQSFYSVSVRENSPNGTIVTQLSVFSSDGGTVTCAILNNAPQPFSIGKQSAIISVNGDVDYELLTAYELTVSCYTQISASSETIVQIIVINMNDFKPVFEQTVYRGTLVENAPRGSLSLQIRATDMDAGNAGTILRFLLYQSTHSFFVESFNHTSGHALISNLAPFDHEAIKSVEFQVRAIDRGSPPLFSDPATIIVEIEDENDNAPVFGQDVYFTTFIENKVGVVIETTALDSDHGNRSGSVLGYEIQPPTHPFIISDSGLISVSEAIDYESFGSVSEARIQLSVRAFDGFGLTSKPALVFINILNENDNVPRPMYASEWPLKIVQLEWGIPVSAHPVFTLSAVDDDKSDSLFYFIETVSPEFPFTLPHLKSGEIIVQRPLTELTFYRFTVTVQDRHPLFFLPDTNLIRWEVQVDVVDTNSPPYFSASRLFQQLTIKRGRIILNSPLLLLVAQDDDFPQSAFATIDRYIISPLNAPLNSTNNLPFSVSANGELVITIPPLESQYAFTVAAVDGGGLIAERPVAITVFIQDENNFAPSFEDQDLQVFLSTSADVGFIIADISVSDGDEGPGGQVECFLQRSVSYFAINEKTCTVTVAKSLSEDDLDGSEFDVTIIATDKGNPPLSTSIILRITIESGKLELVQNITKVTFIEEGGPVKLGFELENNRLSPEAQYTLEIYIAPTLASSFTPDSYSTQCLSNGNIVNLLDCFTGSDHLLAETSNTDSPTRLSSSISTPILVQRSSSTSFVFQTWIKTNHIGTRNIVGAYFSNQVTENEPLFVIQVSQTSLIIISGGNRISFSINFPNELSLSTNKWHHLAVMATSLDTVTVYVDGSNIGSTLFNYDFNALPEQVYLYVGRGEEDISIFTTFLWKASFKFGFEENDLLQSLSCMLNCGESLATNISGDGELTWKISTGTLQARTDSLPAISQMLALLSYENKATEPLTYPRLITISVGDGRSLSNATISINTQLINDNTALLDLNINSRRDVFYFVAPSRSPYPAPLASSVLFTDMDTTQTDYRARIDIVSNDRSCDRLDYSPKIKLEQCISNTQATQNVHNLLPNPEWSIHKLLNVRRLQLSLFGYYFYAKGMFVPDKSVYDSLTLTPDKFSVVFWIQYYGPGTVMSVRNETMNFTIKIRADKTHLTLDYSNQYQSSVRLSWPWEPMEGWSHILLSLNKNDFMLCIDGTECSSQSITSVDFQPNSFSGVEAFVGALPGNDLTDSTDRFTGTLGGMALISGYVIPVDILNCVIECAERIVLTSSSIIRDPLTSLLNPFSTGIAAANGTIQIANNLEATEVEKVLRQAAYINTHPYQYSGTRSIQFSVYDGNNLVKPRTSARLSVHVLHHRQRTVSLLRLGRQTLSAPNIISGAYPFASAGISSDTKSNNLDSLLVRIISMPFSQTSCYRSSVSNNQCQNLFSIDQNLLIGTKLEISVKPTQLLIYGLSNVTHYNELLHQILFQSDDPSSIVTATSEVSIRVYISDMNGIASSGRTTTIFVQDSSVGARSKRAALNNNMAKTPNSFSFTSTFLLSCVLVTVIVLFGMFVLYHLAKRY